MENNKLNLIDTIVLAFYYVFVCFLTLGLMGWFNRTAVFLTVGALVLLIFLLRQRINFNKKYWWFFLLAPLVGAGFGFLRGFFSGDAYGFWLPAARDIASGGGFVGWATNYFFARMPLMPLLLAGTFSLLGSFDQFLSLWIPLFFAAATLALLWQWGKDQGLKKKFLIFLPFLFLTNIVVEFYGSWNLLQEPVILFFATAFFYYYEKYEAQKERKDLIFLLLCLVLAAAAKISGLFLFLLLPFVFFKSADKKKMVLYFLIFFLPVAVWLVRNYLVFDNPVFPSFNGFFGGRYGVAIENHGFYHPLPDELVSFLDRVWWFFKNYLWMSLPFILLSFYGFFIRRRYDYLLLIVSYALVKEIFLFTYTDSSIRYYYLFFGLFLIYALVGLRRIKSRLFMASLILLAAAGLLLVPFTDSTSQFISFWENRLSWLGSLFEYLARCWYLVLLALAPFAYLASRKSGAKTVLVFLYCFYILHLRFVANKSWLNTWPFVFLALSFLVIFALWGKLKHSKKVMAALVVLAVVANSWLMGAGYYWQQGKIELPVMYVWGNSQWAKGVLNNLAEPDERDDFYVLIATQTGYFAWWTNYRAITLFNEPFWVWLGDYDRDMTDQELRELLERNKVKYVVKNEADYDFYAEPMVQFFEKIENSPLFTLMARKENKYFVWRVY